MQAEHFWLGGTQVRWWAASKVTRGRSPIKRSRGTCRFAGSAATGMGQAVLDCHERVLAPAGNGPRSGPGSSTASPRLGCPAASPGSASCPPVPRPAAAYAAASARLVIRRRRHRRVPAVQVSDQRLLSCDPLRLRRDQRITRISGWLPLATAHRSRSAMIPETTPSHRSNTAPAAKTQPAITHRNIKPRGLNVYAG